MSLQKKLDLIRSLVEADTEFDDENIALLYYSTLVVHHRDEAEFNKVVNEHYEICVQSKEKKYDEYGDENSDYDHEKDGPDAPEYMWVSEEFARSLGYDKQYTDKYKIELTPESRKALIAWYAK